MLEIFRLAVEKYELYQGIGMHMALFFAALIYLSCSAHKSEKKLFSGYSAVFFLIYFCPLTAKIMMDFCVGRDVYWRMFWILPIPLILSYAGVRAYQTQKKNIYKGVLLASLILVIAVCGYPVYASQTVMQKAENLQKVPSSASAVCEIIRSDAGKDGYAKAAVPEELVGYIRQYDAGIGLAYGRRGYKSKADKKIYAQMTAENPSFRKMVRAVRKAECNYLVYYEEKSFKTRIENQSFREIGRTNGYIIFKEQNNA